MSESRDDTSALAAALRAASTDSKPREDCPSADRIWGAVSRELPPDARRDIIDHTIDCPACAELWRLAMELVPVTEAPVAASSTLAASQPRPVFWPLATAAAVIMALGAAFWFAAVRPPQDPTFRNGPTGEVRSLVESAGSLPRDNFLLKWSGGPPGTRYDLTATTAQLEVLAMVRGLEQAEYRIASGRLAGLAPGARVLWRVVAHARDGSTISSPTFEVPVE